MERSADTQIDQVKRLVLSMGGCVEQALENAVHGLTQRQDQRFSAIGPLEERINDAHIKVDELCAHFLATQQPVAKDLRMIISFIKMNTDLERMGDQCMNISYIGRDYLDRKITLPMQMIEEMGVAVRQMVRECLDAVVREDTTKARAVLLMDDEVDSRKEKVVKDLTAAIKGDPRLTDVALDVIMIAKNLERLGDHATNIAEDVIYVSTGKDIRHGRS